MVMDGWTAMSALQLVLIRGGDAEGSARKSRTLHS